MTNSYSINCFPIRVKEEKVTIHWSNSERDGLIRSLKSKLTNCKEDRQKLIFWLPDEFPSSSPIEIDAANNAFLFRDFLSYELHKYLQSLGIPFRRSFLGGTEVWIHDGGSEEGIGSEYRAFTMRVLNPKDQYATSGWTILLSCRGKRFTQRSSGSATKIPDELVTWFVSENKIIHAREWHEDQNLPSELEVLINRPIEKHLQLPRRYHKEPNKYQANFNQIVSFFNSYLKGNQIGSLMHVLESGMGQIFASQVRTTPFDDNILEFGNKRTHFNAYMGLKEYGPLAGPENSRHKLFFIFDEKHKDHANKLYQYFNRGFKGYPGLKSFVDVDLNLDKEKTIIFKDTERPHREIKENLSCMTFEDGIDYLAVYISPIPRDADEEKRKEYFLIKQYLLAQGVNSQVIYAENINKPDFNYSLPNISIAMLAKLGGRPWRLRREIKDELIFGVGAYRQIEGEKFLGTTFTFRNDGTFIGFDAIRCNAADELSDFFESTLKKLVSKSRESSVGIKRVVIHFYKKMNKDEERQLIEALRRLELQVPHFILTITGEKQYEYLVFDEAFAGKLPQSGTCIKLRNGEYLLCNNTRYKERTGTRISDYPFPLKISISSSSDQGPRDEKTNHELIDQVYQFSRMYWTSVKQRAMPVTILYSEKVAEMTASLPDHELPQTRAATETLWFL